MREEKRRIRQSLLEPASLRKELEEEGWALVAWTDAPGSRCPFNQHPEDQLFVILAGCLSVIMDGKELRLEGGDRFLIPAETRFDSCVRGDEPARYLVGFRRLASS